MFMFVVFPAQVKFTLQPVGRALFFSGSELFNGNITGTAVVTTGTCFEKASTLTYVLRSSDGQRCTAPTMYQQGLVWPQS